MSKSSFDAREILRLTSASRHRWCLRRIAAKGVIWGTWPGYYDEIVSVVRGAESVFIFGPGEAKGELRKHFHKQNLCERIVGFEMADKMTDRQVAQKVRNFYAAAPAIPLTNGDQLKQT